MSWMVMAIWAGTSMVLGLAVGRAMGRIEAREAAVVRVARDGRLRP
jgi:hypothetical protein